jgi:hypothetical protein
MFRRRRTHKGSPVASDPGAQILSVVWDEDEGAELRRVAEREEARRELRALVAEAVIRQDEGAEVLAAIRRREPLADLAPRGGPLIRRFCELRDRLPESDDPEVRRITEALGPLLYHHALMLSTSLDMLAVDWRSPRVVEQLEKINGFGPPAERLEAIRSELIASHW